MQTVVDETIALFHWLEWVANEIYGEDARGAARRWTLRRLHRYGPQTVPQLAKSTPMRRQSLQPVVDALASEALVSFEENPTHARSKLVCLTQRGIDLVMRLDDVDARVLRAAGRGIKDADLAIAAVTLKSLRHGFEVESRWRNALADSSPLGRRVARSI